MSSISTIEELMKSRLTEDSSDQMDKAGALWQDLQLGFYYQDENAAQIAAADVASDAAAGDGNQLPESVLHHLQNDIALQTVVKKAVSRIFTATFAPEPL